MERRKRVNPVACASVSLAVYINHRPAFGLDPERLEWAFEKLGIATPNGNAIERGDLLDMLQTKGKVKLYIEQIQNIVHHTSSCELLCFIRHL